MRGSRRVSSQGSGTTDHGRMSGRRRISPRSMRRSARSPRSERQTRLIQTNSTAPFADATNPMNDNPLLDFSDLPRFGEIRADHIVPAIDALLADARAVVERIAQDTSPASWDNVVAPAEATFDHLDRAWGAVRHLNAVVNTPAIRDGYNAALPKVTAFHADMAQDPRSYARFRALADAASFADLEDARRKVVELSLIHISEPTRLLSISYAVFCL